jgi:hypothetical protein
MYEGQADGWMIGLHKLFLDIISTSLPLQGKTTLPYMTYFHAAMAAIPVGNIDESAPLPPNAPPINMQFLSLKTKTKLIDILRIIFI